MTDSRTRTQGTSITRVAGEKALHQMRKDPEDAVSDDASLSFQNFRPGYTEPGPGNPSFIRWEDN